MTDFKVTKIDKLGENTAPTGNDKLIIKNAVTGKDEFVRFSNLGTGGSAVDLSWKPLTNYVTGDIKEFLNKLWKATQDNYNQVPYDGSDYWDEVSRAFGTRYVANTVFTQADVFVVYDESWYELASTVTRPFESTDIDQEIIDGKWKIIGTEIKKDTVCIVDEDGEKRQFNDWEAAKLRCNASNAGVVTIDLVRHVVVAPSYVYFQVANSFVINFNGNSLECNGTLPGGPEPLDTLTLNLCDDVILRSPGQIIRNDEIEGGFCLRVTNTNSVKTEGQIDLISSGKALPLICYSPYNPSVIVFNGDLYQYGTGSDFGFTSAITATSNSDVTLNGNMYAFGTIAGVRSYDNSSLKINGSLQWPNATGGGVNCGVGSEIVINGDVFAPKHIHSYDLSSGDPQYLIDCSVAGDDDLYITIRGKVIQGNSGQVIKKAATGDGILHFTTLQQNWTNGDPSLTDGEVEYIYETPLAGVEAETEEVVFNAIPHLIKESETHLYYNAASGDNSNSGSYKHPKQTIDPDQAFSTGTKIHLHTGMVYPPLYSVDSGTSELNSLLVNGTEDSPFEINAYGGGSVKPILSCGIQLTGMGYTDLGDGVYRFDLTPGQEVYNMFLGEDRVPMSRDIIEYSVDDYEDVSGVRSLISNDLVESELASGYFVGCLFDTKIQAWNPYRLDTTGFNPTLGKITYDKVRVPDPLTVPGDQAVTGRFYNHVDFLPNLDVCWCYDKASGYLYLKLDGDTPDDGEYTISIAPAGIASGLTTKTNTIEHWKLQDIDIKYAGKDAINLRGKIRYNEFKNIDGSGSVRNTISLVGNNVEKDNAESVVDGLIGENNGSGIVLLGRPYKPTIKNCVGSINPNSEHIGYQDRIDSFVGENGNGITITCFDPVVDMSAFVFKNVVKSSGCDGMSISGQNNDISYNDVQQHGRLGTDCGAYYQGGTNSEGVTFTKKNTYFRNKASDPYQGVESTQYTDLPAARRGFYCDNKAGNTHYIENVAIGFDEGFLCNIKADDNSYLANISIRNKIHFAINHQFGGTMNIAQGVIIKYNHIVLASIGERYLAWDASGIDEDTYPINDFIDWNFIYMAVRSACLTVKKSGLTSTNYDGIPLSIWRKVYPAYDANTKIIDISEQMDEFVLAGETDNLSGNFDETLDASPSGTYFPLSGGATHDTSTVPGGGGAVKMPVIAAVGSSGGYACLRSDYESGLNEGDAFRFTFDVYCDNPDGFISLYVAQGVTPYTQFKIGRVQVPYRKWSTVKAHYLHDGIDLPANNIQIYIQPKGVGASVTANYWVKNLTMVTGTRGLNQIEANAQLIKNDTDLAFSRQIDETIKQNIRRVNAVTVNPGETIMNIITSGLNRLAVPSEELDESSARFTLTETLAADVPEKVAYPVAGGDWDFAVDHENSQDGNVMIFTIHQPNSITFPSDMISENGVEPDEESRVTIATHYDINYPDGPTLLYSVINV